MSKLELDDTPAWMTEMSAEIDKEILKKVLASCETGDAGELLQSWAIERKNNLKRKELIAEMFKEYEEESIKYIIASLANWEIIQLINFRRAVLNKDSELIHNYYPTTIPEYKIKKLIQVDLETICKTRLTTAEPNIVNNFFEKHSYL